MDRSHSPTFPYKSSVAIHATTATAIFATAMFLLIANAAGWPSPALNIAVILVSFAYFGVALALQRGGARHTYSISQADQGAVVVHELRSPLTSATGFVRLVHESSTIDQQTRDQLETALRNMHVLQERIDALTSQHAKLRRRDCDLTTLLADAVDAARLNAAAHKIAIELDIDEITIDADSLRLRQVIDNLVDNAVKYGKPGGTVTVSAHALPTTDNVEIIVQDNGPGLSDDDRARALTPYFRSKSARLSRIPGQGLGLAICHEIIELHGGEITVESTPGHGSLFIVRLPSSSKSLPRTPPLTTDSHNL